MPVMTDKPGRYVLAWCRPNLLWYRTSDPAHVRVKPSRYAGVTYGVAVQIGDRVLHLRWGVPVEAAQ